MLIPDGHMNMSLWQLLQESFGMPTILRCLQKLILMQEKHNRCHTIAYDALINVPMFFYDVLQYSYDHFQTLEECEACLIIYVSIVHQLQNKKKPCING